MFRSGASNVRCIMLAILTMALASIAVCEIGGSKSRYLDGSPRFLTLPANFTAPAGAATASTSLPVWTGSFVFNGSRFPYTMVGTDPAAGSKTTVQAIIVPLKFSFSDGTVLDPTAPAFGSSQSAVNSTVMSPLFQAASFAPGGTGVGTTQYIDAFQRANFWSQVSTISPNYHVLLTQPYVLASAVQVNVPSLFGNTVAGPGARIGQVSLFYFDLWLTAVLSKITSVQPNQLLIFLAYNTFFTQQGCCILGFHEATGLSAATARTIVVAAWRA